MNISYNRIWAQALKEIDQFRRDKMTVGLAFVLPVAALLMYGFVTRLESKDLPVAIYNFDNGKLSRELIDTLYANVQLTPAQFTSTNVLTPLDLGKAKAAIIIPANFSRDIKAKREAKVQAVIDAVDVNNARVVKNAIVATLNFYLAQENLTQDKRLVKLEPRLWFNPGRQEALHIVPGALALVLWVFPALLSTLALVREKEQGTILQIYASNLTSLEFIAGKAIAYLLVGLIEGALLVLTAVTVFGLKLVAEPITFIVCSVLYVLSAVLFGLWAATKANTQMAAVQLVANIGFLGTMLLSGFIYPLRNVAFPLSLSYIVPAQYFIQATRNEFVRGGSWLALWYVPAVLLLIDFILLMMCSKMKMRLTG